MCSSHPSIGLAHAKIAPTQQNESQNDALVIPLGFAARTTMAAIASVRHEMLARPQARAVRATDAIVAARSAGTSSPLNVAKAHTESRASEHPSAREAPNHVA